MSHKILCLLGLIFALASTPLHAQRWREMWENPDQYTMAEIRAEFNAYYATHPVQRGDGSKQFLRWEWLLGSSLDANGKVVNDPSRAWRALKAYQDQQAATQRSLDLDGNWTFVGATKGVNEDGLITGIGRVNTVAFHPTDPNTLYVGTPAGGIWKTTNHGSTWTPKSRNYPFHGVSSIAIPPSAPNTIYIMTGDDVSNRSRSQGVWKSTDGGSSWVAKTPTLNYEGEFYSGRKVVVDPANALCVYAVFGNGSGRGIYRSTDGGDTWTGLYLGYTFHDLVLHPTTSSTLYAARVDKVYRKTSSDPNFVLKHTMPSGTISIRLGVSPASPNTVYAYAGGTNAPGTFIGLYRSTKAGDTFTVQSTTPNIQGYKKDGTGNVSIADYAFALGVNPAQADKLHAGCVRDWASTNGGQTWTGRHVMAPDASEQDDVHMDCHELAYNNGKVYYCHDGGIHYSTDEGLHWIDISSGLGITETYRIAGSPAAPNLLMIGNQDNGTHKIEGTFPVSTMLEEGGGDGFDCIIDPGNPAIRYLSTWYDPSPKLFYSLNSGTDYYSLDATSVLGNGAWVAPYILNPRKSSTVVAGHADVGVYYRAGSNSGWINLSNGQLGLTKRCKALAMAPSDTSTIYAIKDSVIYRTSNYGGLWSIVTSNLPLDNYSSIVIDPANASHVFVSLSSWNSPFKVYESVNGGGSWQPLGTGLPDVPAYCLAYQADTRDGLYLGTEVGVYYRDDDTGGWVYFSDGMPTVRVTDLDLNPTVRKVRAATWGASIWESDYYLPPCSTGTNLSGTITGTVDILVDGVLTSTQQLVVPADVLYQSATGIALNAGFSVPAGARFSGEIGPCTVVQSSRTVLPDVVLPSPGTAAAAAAAPPKAPAVRIHPNPATDRATLEIDLPAPAQVRVEVYDLAMRRVALVADSPLQPGTHPHTISTGQLPAGTYLVRVQLGGQTSVHRLVVQH